MDKLSRTVTMLALALNLSSCKPAGCSDWINNRKFCFFDNDYNGVPDSFLSSDREMTITIGKYGRTEKITQINREYSMSGKPVIENKSSVEYFYPKGSKTRSVYVDSDGDGKIDSWY